MKLKIADNQLIDEVVDGSTVVTREPTSVSASKGKSLLQLQNKRGPLVVEAPDDGSTEDDSEGES